MSYRVLEFNEFLEIYGQCSERGILLRFREQGKGILKI